MKTVILYEVHLFWTDQTPADLCEENYACQQIASFIAERLREPSTAIQSIASEKIHEQAIEK